MRHRNARERRHSYSGGHAGHNLERYIILHKRLGLLATTPQHKRIAPLESDHRLALHRFVDQDAIYLSLLDCMIPGGLADIYQLGIAACVGQQPVIHQTVIYDNVSLLQ